MNIKMIGCNQAAPLAVREWLAFSPVQVVEAMLGWDSSFSGIEAVLLSTCNRTELYLAAEEHLPLPSREELIDFLAERKGFDTGTVTNGSGAAGPRETVENHLIELESLDAVAHLFAVASSLDSMVLGEAQISAQVKAAYQSALEAGTTGPITHSVFQAALKAAKRVANETEIQQRRLSIPSVAVGDFVLRLFERLTNRTALILGTGEMGEETIRYLQLHGMSSIQVANRNRKKAEKVAATWGGAVVDWEDRLECFASVDLAVGTTGAPHPILTSEQFRRIVPRRLGKPLFLLDLAVPRDFEAAIGDFPEVYLYTIDDLKGVCEENRRARDHEMPKARQIIEQETDRFSRDMNHRRTGEMIARLRSQWKSVQEEEVRRLLNKLGGLDAKGEKEVRYAFDRLVNKLLHPPLESLRDESRHGVPQGLLDALARLFRLK